jgi:hypothetical protein
MAAIPWKHRHFSTVGPVNHGHPHLKGCVFLFDQAKRFGGSKPVGSSPATSWFFNREIGRSNLHMDTTASSTDRFGGHIEGFRSYCKGGAGFVQTTENIGAEEVREGAEIYGDMRWDVFTIMFWSWWANPGGTSSHASYLGTTHNSWSISNSGGTNGLNWQCVDANENTTVTRFADAGYGNTADYMGAAIVGNKGSQFVTFCTFNKTNGFATENTPGYSVSHTVGARVWTESDTRFAFKTFSAQLNEEVFQWRLYNRNIPLNQVRLMLMDPYCVRSGRRGSRN